MNQRVCIYESIGINKTVGRVFLPEVNKVRRASGIAKVICERVYDLSGKDRGHSMIPKERASAIIHKAEAYDFHEDLDGILSIETRFLPDEDLIQEELERYEAEQQQRHEQEHFRQYSQAFRILLGKVMGYQHVFSPDQRVLTVFGALRGFFDVHKRPASLDARDELLSTFLMTFAHRFPNGPLPDSQAKALIRLFDVWERYTEINIVSGWKRRAQSWKKMKR